MPERRTAGAKAPSSAPRAAPPSLAKYRAKRDFGVTPEPADTTAATKGQQLSFVIQKHDATRLHYDFRLELDGVLLSWAVPKGPSLDPADKRMAVRTEDHPLAYAAFEGDIPPGQYGAGRVIVWDRGTWAPRADPHQGLAAGKLAFELHGHKLRGEWELVRMKPRAGAARQEAWLLFKKRDAHARTHAEEDIVRSQPDSVLGQAAPPQPSTPAVEGNAGAAAAVPAPLPKTLAPQLATAVSAVPAQGRWVFEDKFDGYRMLACIDGGVPRLVTRGGHDWTAKMPRVAQALAELAIDTAWLDGEIVVGHGGSGAFNKLQNAFDRRAAGADSDLVYMLFDLPYFEGHDLRGAPLHARRELLRQMLQSKAVSDTTPGPLRLSAALGEGDAELGARLLKAACAQQREGLIAKRVDTPYRGVRDGSWLKLKCRLRQEFVVGGYTVRGDDRTAVGSLVLGVHDEGGPLRHAGSVGTGWDTETARSLLQQLKKLGRETSPFAGEKPASTRWRQGGAAPVQWVRPTLVVEVNFGEWTPGDHIRHASFVGVRHDKPARSITREDVRDPPAPVPGSSAAGGHTPRRTTHPTPHHTPPHITHPERVVDAASGLTKIDLVHYYESVSAWMLPHLAGRPVALLRAPGGVGASVFFQKHAQQGSIPGVVTLDPALWPGHEALLEVRDVEGLVGAAQMNTVEFHIWNARVKSAKSLGKPDRLVFDLDPGEGVDWPAIREGALLTRALLQELGLESWLKTSGGKGLHVVVPIAARWPFETVKAFAKAVVQHLARTVPERFVAKSGPANRKGRIFVDYLRNGEGATTVAPYSARARPGLGVSMPLSWDELPAVKSAAQWTVANARDRLSMQKADPWAGLGDARQSLSAPLKQMKLPAAAR